MKVKQLAEALTQCDPEALIMIEALDNFEEADGVGEAGVSIAQVGLVEGCVVLKPHAKLIKLRLPYLPAPNVFRIDERSGDSI